jgi:NLR family CARD domain-containing protein 3
MECYKYYSAMGVSSGVWNITLNPYTDFCKDSGIIDEKLLLTKDFDRIFIATYTKTDKVRNMMNPDRALVRYQFMEGIFRLSEQKYLSNGVVNTQKEALEMCFKENVAPYINTYDVQTWRDTRLWNEECDTVIKSYLPVFKEIYKDYSKEKVKPSETPFMCLEEFQRLVKLAGFESDKCGERDSLLSFRYAMQTQVDELNNKRITEMKFVEFIEAIARLLDIYSPPPYLTQVLLVLID